MSITTCSVDSQWEPAEEHRELSLVLSDDLEGWDGVGWKGGPSRKGRICTYSWFTSLHSRHYHYIVKQWYSTLKKVSIFTPCILHLMKLDCKLLEGQEPHLIYIYIFSSIWIWKVLINFGWIFEVKSGFVFKWLGVLRPALSNIRDWVLFSLFKKIFWLRPKACGI